MYLAFDQFGPRAKYDIAKADLTYTPDGLTWDGITTYSKFDDNSGIATMQNFQKLYGNSNVEVGFGALYADGATVTAMTVPEAYGYSRYDSEDVRGKKGMCGVFVYYWDKKNTSSYNARNIFFPLGRAGYGHRKGVNEPKGVGTLRYACANRDGLFSALSTAPLFYDLILTSLILISTLLLKSMLEKARVLVSCDV